MCWWPVPTEVRGNRSLKLELQAVVSCLMWMLGDEFWSSGRIIHA